MISLTIYVRGDKQMIRNISRIVDNLPKMGNLAAWNVAQIYASEMRKWAMQHSFSGYSKRAIKPRKLGEGLYGVVAPYYWRYLEHGARYHLTGANKAVRWVRQRGRGNIKRGNVVGISTGVYQPARISARFARPRIAPMLKKTAGRYIQSRGRQVE